MERVAQAPGYRLAHWMANASLGPGEDVIHHEIGLVRRARQGKQLATARLADGIVGSVRDRTQL